MPSRRRGRQLLGVLWERVVPLLPARTLSPKGGRPWADDKACLAGVVYALRSGIRWHDMPPCFPSGVTCWRRHRDWTAAGVWDRVWQLALAELAAAGEPDPCELVIDATSAEGRKGGNARAARAVASA